MSTPDATHEGRHGHDGQASSPLMRPWRYALAWLVFLGPCFFATYGFANAFASRQHEVPSYVFGWERHTPFLDWTIVPYMSIDLFYAVSLFVCTSRAEVRQHALRLLLATLISVACFLAYPLKFSFDRPATSGIFGWLFDLLTGFDQPFNQAPSLHIALLIQLWVVYGRHLRGVARHAIHIWFALIAVSVLTTYQHHAIDVVSGAALGVLLLYFLPDPPYGWSRSRLPDTPAAAAARRRLARKYGGGAVLLALVALASFVGGPRLALAGALLCWPALALAMVAAGYGRWGTAVFQKVDGQMSQPARWVLAPYLVAAWISSRVYTRRLPRVAQVTSGVWIGRIPTGEDLRSGKFDAVVDLCAELPAPRHARAVHYEQLPMLDLVAPSAEQLTQAAAAIERAQAVGPTLVHCALGFSRSAQAVAAWLITRGANADAALAHVRAARPAIVIGPDSLAALRTFAHTIDEQERAHEL